MNEITIHGNVTADLKLTYGREGSGVAFTTFSVAVNHGYYDRARSTWVGRPPVYHQVVAFGELAENAAATLAKGTAVTVTGQLADNSYTEASTERLVRRIRLEAADIAVSLRRATATVAKRERSDDQPQAQADPVPAAA